MARKVFKKEEMLELSLGGVRLRLGNGEEGLMKRTFWKETNICEDTDVV